MDTSIQSVSTRSTLIPAAVVSPAFSTCRVPSIETIARLPMMPCSSMSCALTAKLNSSKYPYASNRRYSWQRWTGVVALVYLFFHVLHLHGWSHAQWWHDLIHRFGLPGTLPVLSVAAL